MNCSVLKLCDPAGRKQVVTHDTSGKLTKTQQATAPCPSAGAQSNLRWRTDRRRGDPSSQAGSPAGAAAAGQVAGPPRGPRGPPPAPGPPPPSPSPPPAGASPRGPRARRPSLRSPPGSRPNTEQSGREAPRARTGREGEGEGRCRGRMRARLFRGPGRVGEQGGGERAWLLREDPRRLPAGRRPLRSPEPGVRTARGQLPPDSRGRGQEARFKVTRPEQVGLAGRSAGGAAGGLPVEPVWPQRQSGSQIMVALGRAV